MYMQNDTIISQSRYAKYQKKPLALDTIKKFMKNKKYKGTFIDFGCDDGHFTFSIESLFNDVIGVDTDIKKINDLLKIKPEYSYVKFIIAHNYLTALADSCCDVIFMFNLLHSINNNQLIIKEIKRLLKEDGELWILEPKNIANKSILSNASDSAITKKELNLHIKDDELNFIEFVDIDKNFYGIKYSKNEELFMRYYRANSV